VTTWDPQVGDFAVDLKVRTFERDRLGRIVTVRQVTPTLVVTSDGERYNRKTMRPVTQPISARELASPTDVRVLTAQSREHLSGVAETARNLSIVPLRQPYEALLALEQIIMAAKIAHGAVSELMAEADYRKQARP
jgi:hypothetical protein